MDESHLDLNLDPESPGRSAAVLAARYRRALVDSIAGGRGGRARLSESAGTRAETTEGAADSRPVATPMSVPQLQAQRVHSAHSVRPTNPTPAARPAAAQLQLEDAVVIPAGALVRGYLRVRSLLLVGDIVGNVHCTAGPVVIRAGATLRGRLVASGDVYVCGTVGEAGGGVMVATRGKLTLAPGSRVEGDVRSGRLDIHDGAMLNGVARAYED